MDGGESWGGCVGEERKKPDLGNQKRVSERF